MARSGGRKSATMVGAIAALLRESLGIILRSKETRKTLALTVAFLALTIAGGLVSVWSNALVLTLNTFVMLHTTLLLTSVLVNFVATAMSHRSGAVAAVGRGGSHSSFSGNVAVGVGIGGSTGGGEDQDDGGDAGGLLDPQQYPFGFQRLSVLFSFASWCTLFFACLFAVVEGLQRLLEEHDVHPIFVEAIACTHIVLTSYAAFHTKPEQIAQARRGRAAAGSGGSTSGVVSGLIGFFLVENISPLTTLLSCQSVVLTGLGRLDTMFGMMLAVVICAHSVESISESASVLLTRSPTGVQRAALEKAIREVRLIPGVLECTRWEFWTVASGLVVGTLRVRISRTTDGHGGTPEQAVLRDTRRVLEPLLFQCTIQIDEGGGGDDADGENVDGDAAVDDDQWRSSFASNSNANGSGCADSNHSHGHGHSHQHGSSCADSHHHGHSHGASGGGGGGGGGFPAAPISAPSSAAAIRPPVSTPPWAPAVHQHHHHHHLSHLNNNGGGSSSSLPPPPQLAMPGPATNTTMMGVAGFPPSPAMGVDEGATATAAAAGSGELPPPPSFPAFPAAPVQLPPLPSTAGAAGSRGAAGMEHHHQPAMPVPFPLPAMPVTAAAPTGTGYSASATSSSEPSSSSAGRGGAAAAAGLTAAAGTPPPPPPHHHHEA